MSILGISKWKYKPNENNIIFVPIELLIINAENILFSRFPRFSEYELVNKWITISECVDELGMKVWLGIDEWVDK